MARHPRSRRRIPSPPLGLVPPPSSTPCRLWIRSIQTLSAPDDLRGQTEEPSRTFNIELWSVGFVFARSLVAGRARIGALSGCWHRHAPARQVAPRRGPIWSGGGRGAERRPVGGRRVGR